MTAATAPLAAAAAVFVLLVGANDGASLLAVGLRTHAFGPWTAGLLLVGALVAAPAVAGTRVADTLASGLVAADSAVLLVALVAAIAAVALAAGTGRSTSLTLALVGGLAGAGVASGAAADVSWRAIATVAVIAVAAPAAAAVLAWALPPVLARVPGRHLRAANRAAFGLQCAAYGANDGQKVLAVVVIALGALPHHGRELALLAGLTATALFAAGARIGVRRTASTLGSGVMLVRPAHALTAQVTSAVAVIGGASLGAPVSMTQALTAAVVGSGIRDGYGRVRWDRVGALGVSWLVTLPVAFVVAAGCTTVLDVAR